MKRVGLIVAVTVGLGVMAGGLMFFLRPSSQPIPDHVRQAFGGRILLPQADGLAIPHDSVIYNTTQHLLTFDVAAYGQTLVVSQQPSPADLATGKAYQQLMAEMHQYATFDVPLGTVHLTRPGAEGSGARQAAVLKSGGTLLFVQPLTDLDQATWQIFFASLTIAY